MNPNHMKSVFLGGAALAVLAVGGAGPVSARDTAAAEQPDSAALEYVIPGTSARTKAMLVTSSVSSVTGDEVSIPSANINNMLYGRIPGLVVSQTNGEPGYDAATLSIRGVATYNNSSLPVYVDGFQTNMAYFQFLSPAEIDRIEVLKDAAALAPFGMRGANGVIWVTTKRGRIGRPRVTVNVRGGVQQPMNLQKPLRTGDYTRLYNEALSNDNGNVWTPYYTADQVARLPTWTGTARSPRRPRPIPMPTCRSRAATRPYAISCCSATWGSGESTTPRPTIRWPTQASTATISARTSI